MEYRSRSGLVLSLFLNVVRIIIAITALFFLYEVMMTPTPTLKQCTLLMVFTLGAISGNIDRFIRGYND